MAIVTQSAGQDNAGLPIIRTRKQGRVLLFEPDTNTHDNLRFLLGSQGYDVFIAVDLAKAYSLSRFKGFAFILFNWFMEEQAGLELCKYIRAKNRATPVFFYTIEAHENRPDSNLEAIIQSYDVKPIDANAILKTIFLHLEKHRAKPSSAGKTF
jgi:two-component system, OmpR family, response regulator ArlR